MYFNYDSITSSSWKCLLKKPKYAILDYSRVNLYEKCLVQEESQLVSEYLVVLLTNKYPHKHHTKTPPERELWGFVNTRDSVGLWESDLNTYSTSNLLITWQLVTVNEFLNHECLYLTCKTKAGFAPGHFPCKNEQIQTTQVWTSMTLFPSRHF